MLTSQAPTPVQLPLSAAQLDAINVYLRTLPPSEILQWAVQNLPGLYQTTAFGLTGLVGIDMLSKITPTPPPLIFLDTLYHFQETLDLVEQVRERYHIGIHVYRPYFCETAQDFESLHGQRLWETDEDSYDYLVKVWLPAFAPLLSLIFPQIEPASRAYNEHNVRAVITGRRASQGADRASLQPLEVDSTGMLKLNPFFAWSFAQIKAYVDEYNVPKNALLAKGYKSVGDWHSTQPASADGDGGERAGRWAGREKTECGLHKDFFKMRLASKKKVCYLILLRVLRRFSWNFFLATRG